MELLGRGHPEPASPRPPTPPRPFRFFATAPTRSLNLSTARILAALHSIAMPKTPSPQAAQFRQQLEADYASRFPKSLAFDRRRREVLLDSTSHAARWNIPFQVTI